MSVVYADPGAQDDYFRFYYGPDVGAQGGEDANDITHICNPSFACLMLRAWKFALASVTRSGTHGPCSYAVIFQ